MFVIALLKHETWQSHLNKLVKVLFGRNSFRGQNSSATHIIRDSVCLAPQTLLLQTLAMHLSFMNPLQQSCSEKVPILSLLSSLRCLGLWWTTMEERTEEANQERMANQ